MKRTANDIIRVLANKHRDDVFIPECKDGPSQTRSHRRLDAWAMARSWSRPLVTGYEVKISRSDFANDNKWQDYLPLCNQLYFVCPANLIQPDELPPQVGLYWVSSGGSRAYLKKKAEHRSVQIPESLWRYIVMCRSVIGADRDGTMTKSRADWLRGWLEQKADLKELGVAVSRRVRKFVDDVKFENERLQTPERILREHKSADDRTRAESRPTADL